MIDTGGEVDFGGFEWVVGGEVYRQEENAAGIWTITLFNVLSAPLSSLSCTATNSKYVQLIDSRS